MSRLFIVNPYSERVAKKGSTLKLLGKFSNTRCFTLGPDNALSEEVTKAARNDVTHVVLEGGDGTVQSVISAFLEQVDDFETFPSFSIVPGGMTNQVAKNIGLSSARYGSVRKVLSRDLDPVELPLLEVDDPNGPTYSGFLFSTGAIPQITRYTTGELHSKGIGGSIAVLGGILKGMRGDDEALMKTTPVVIDGIYGGLHLGTVVTTLPSLILGIDPFWGRGSGPLRMTWVTGTYRRLTRNILGIWIGRKQKDRTSDGYHSGQFPTLSFQYEGDVVLDGEFLSFPSSKFTIRPTRNVTFLR